MLGFVVNPVAGNGASLKAIAEIEDILKARKIAYKIRYTEYEGHTEQVVKRLVGEGSTAIVSVGGDGTALECAQAIFRLGKGVGEEISLGIIPAGSGNDFARTLSMPANVVQAMGVILEGQTMVADMLNCNGTPVLNIASLGIDSEIANFANKIKRRFSKASYLVSVVKNIFTYKSIEAELKFDEKVIEGKFTIIAMCNGKYYGGGFFIAPFAEIDDGQISVVYVDELPWYKMLVLFPRVPFGKHLGLKEVHVENCTKLQVKYKKDYVFNIDGNIADTNGFITMKIEPETIRIITNTNL